MYKKILSCLAASVLLIKNAFSVNVFLHGEYQKVHRTFLDDYNSFNNNEYTRLNKVWSQFKVAIR
ncbi:hypothetical protein [Spirobacillus cienkowskii]|uniref:hypothetical protein n=1 Tax=Spirobacillus cienkowskii TaxID=495820 RepID=UPI0030D00A34